LRIGGEGINADDLLGLLQYGIRVFVVTSESLNHSQSSDELRAFEDARLLELSVVPDLEAADVWVVDGRMPANDAKKIYDVLSAADHAGAINAGQYKIVHTPPDTDILVTAGAGTGKTETMSERLVFLLTTNDTSQASTNIGHPSDLRLEEVVLLYGNVMGALEKLKIMRENEVSVCKKLWLHLSKGERASSYYRRVALPVGGARAEWVRFLEGSKAKSDPLSKAYQAAIGKPKSLELNDLVSSEEWPLPARLDTDADICRNCPVRNRCLAAESPDDRS